MALSTHLTDTQEQAFHQNADDLARLEPQLDEVHRAAVSRLEGAGFTDILNCLACSACEGWTRGDDGRCGNCPHGFFSHNVI
ncbi:hypothetical protein GCM10010234_75780 [Streptomyces hawaiiensis]